MARDSTVPKRLLVAFAFLFLATAAFSHLHRTYSQKFFDVTGRAQWIWAQHRMSANVPVAFFASRDFDLPEHRIYTHLKVLGDPEYTLYVNGREIAGRQVAADNRAIDLYDISELVRHKGNRIVIAVRSPQGVGGLLASIDIAPETANWIVTNGEWKIHRRWTGDLLVRDPPDWERPMMIGEPPIGRWNYLTIARRDLSGAPATATAPREALSMMGLIPKIKTQSGVAVAVAEEARATAFDFGFTKGRARLTIESPSAVSRAVNVRFANAREELGLIEWKMRPIVFAPGERVVTTPESHDFRYMLVFAKNVGAEAVK
jgi:hypothetical protein